MSEWLSTPSSLPANKIEVFFRSSPIAQKKKISSLNIHSFWALSSVLHFLAVRLRTLSLIRKEPSRVASSLR